MALAKANLGYPVDCVYNNTDTAVYTVASNTKTYIRSLLLHNTTASNDITVSIHFAQNSGGSAAAAADTNMVAKITLTGTDTYFFELAYPFILTSTNDTVRVKNLSTTQGDTVNVTVLGDQEA